MHIQNDGELVFRPNGSDFLNNTNAIMEMDNENGFNEFTRDESNTFSGLDDATMDKKTKD